MYILMPLPAPTPAPMTIPTTTIHSFTFTIFFQIPGVKSKKEGSQSEFCMYGRHIMMGYMKMEDKTQVGG